jgi:signal transduction histidine kinase
MRISLRGRITLWYAVAIPALIFALAFVAQQVLLVSLRSGLDDSLQQRTGEVLSAILTNSLSEKADTFDDEIEFLTEQEFYDIPLFLRIYGPDRTAVSRFGEIPGAVIPELNKLAEEANVDRGSFGVVNLRGVEALRVYTVAILDPETFEPLATIQTGESLAQITSAQQELWRYTILIAGVGSVLALAVGFFLFGRGFAPLDRILRRVQGIETGDLQTGLPAEPRPPELQKLADSLNSMWQRLDAAFKQNQLFVAKVSHELRTPLTVLNGQIDVLLMRPSLSSEELQSLQRMSREVARLVRLTNNLLLNAQLDAKPVLVAGRVDLRALTEEVVGDLFSVTDDRELEFTAPKGVFVSGDYDLLKQMLVNIVENAIKFTSPGDTIAVSVAAEGGRAVVAVRDTGPGIAPQHLPHIMEPFYTADQRSGTPAKGAGLGLAIVKQIVDLHQGAIEVASNLGAGTTVTVRLPLAPAPAHAPSREPAHSLAATD